MTISKKLNYTSRGIYFSSYYLKHKPKLHNFNDNIIVSVQKKLKDVTEFKELNKSSTATPAEATPVATTTTSIPATTTSSLLSSTIISTSNITTLLNTSYSEMWISKTDEPDIYNIYDNHNILTSNKLGIAFIASLQDSIKMRNIFKDKSTTITIKFKCNYNEKFKKYQPIEQII
jgi:hypothetical protein